MAVETGVSIRGSVTESVFRTLTELFMMEGGAVTACLDGTGEDIPIASRLALVVIARVQARLGLPNLVDPKSLRPEEVTSVRSVLNLIMSRLRTGE